MVISFGRLKPKSGIHCLLVSGSKFCRGLLLAISLAPAIALAQSPPLAEPLVDSELEEQEDPRIGSDPTRSAALTQFTTGIENREPVDQVTFVKNDIRQIYFFSDLRGLTGTRVVHRWLYLGQVIAEVEFQVAGPRWRVWSSKELDPESVGDWTVEIVIEGDEVIASEVFTYSAASD